VYVELKEVNVDNYIDILNLRVKPEQEKFVPSSCYLIAKSKFHPNHHARAIYAEGSVVGLVLYQTGDGDFEPHECEIFNHKNNLLISNLVVIRRIKQQEKSTRIAVSSTNSLRPTGTLCTWC